MKIMTPRAIAFTLGLGLSQAVWAQTSFSCNEISETTKQTFEKVVQSGRREIARTEEQGGAMDKPKPAIDISCEAEKWNTVAAAAMFTYWGNGGSQLASAALQGYMKRLIEQACSKLNSELDRARDRVEKVTRPPDYVQKFPYPWAN